MPTNHTGLVFDERYLGHDTGMQTTVVMRHGSFQLGPEPHPSSAYITQRMKQFLDGSGLTAQMQFIPARAATEDEFAAYHTREYIAGVRAHVEGGPTKGDWGEIEMDTPLSRGSFDAARFAVGGAMNAVHAVMEGEVRNAYALLRPPGHHALSNRAMGMYTMVMAPRTPSTLTLACYLSHCINKTGILNSLENWSRWDRALALAAPSTFLFRPVLEIGDIAQHSNNLSSRLDYSIVHSW